MSGTSTQTKLIAANRLGLIAVCLLFCASTAKAVESDPMDWPNWRGPQQNRISAERGLIDHWDPAGGEGSNLLWKNPELAGRSTPIVLRGKLYTIVRDQPGTPNEGEKVVCVDPATGEILWEHRFNVYMSEAPDTRVGWSSCAGDPETGRIYAQGVSGYFCCLDGETGEVVWDRSLHEELGLISTYGGRTNVPVIFEDMVLASAVVVGWGDTDKWAGLAKPAHRFMAFDKAAGELRWMNGTSISPFDTTYSTPTIMPLGGQAALVFGSGDGMVWAFQPRTGQPIWHFPFARAGLNVSPLVTPDGRVFSSHSDENTFGTAMGSAVALDGTKAGDLTDTEVWRQFQVMAGKSSPILVDERLYMVDDGAKLFVLDAATGDLISRKALGTVMRGTPLYADGKIYLCTNTGRWYILRPTPDGVEFVHRTRLPASEIDGSPQEVNASPIVSHGRIFLPTSDNMYCLGQADQVPTADPVPAPPAEAPVAEDSTPAHLQVIPYDVLLSPGKRQSYRVLAFNRRGQLLRELPADKVKFTVDGPGTMSADGTYLAPKETVHQSALVTCQMNGLTGTARVRIVPPLPWEFDFDNAADVPLTWIGGRVRYVVREEDGERIIVKRDVLPTPRDPDNKLGTRSYLYMGQPELANYTIQGDVLLTEGAGRLPDVGLINSRYMMAIRGQSGKLRLDSWSPSDYRTQAMADFEARPNTWYTMKLTVVPEKDSATVRGRIWRRGAKEPEDWTIEIVDHSPNLHGSPGLFGNSGEAEIYLDNITVTAN
jgi:hypothetical protein